MKTLQQIKDEYAQQIGYPSFHSWMAFHGMLNSCAHLNIMYKIYAKECCKATLEKASRCVYGEYDHLINDEENIVLL